MENQLKKIIQEYEEKVITYEQVSEQINSLTNQTVTQYDLDNYWRSESIDVFIKKLTLSVPEHISLDDNQTQKLIHEIMDNLADEILLIKNSEILEKYYSKPSGTITDYIFQDDLEPEEILNKLKHNTTINL